MIKEILIKNFEAHEKLKIKFDPHINSIIGATDQGKSSTIRAIKWVVMNRPLGDTFIRDKSKPAYVGIKTDKGIVSRKKGKNQNIYKINKKVLEAFGTSVPDEVKSFLSMGELNFQFQFDAPYWFMISPGEVSKQLNEIVDMEIIDNTLKNIGKRKREGKSAVDISQERLNNLKSELKQLSFIKSMSKEFSTIESMADKIESKHCDLDALSLSIKEVEKNNKNVKTLSEITQEGHKVLQIGINLKNINEKTERLENLINQIEYNTLIIKSEIPNIKPLLSILKTRKKLKNDYNNLKSIIKNIEKEERTTCQRKEEIKNLKKELKKVMGKECPLCGNPLTK